MRMWGGRFAVGTDPLAADFTRSIEVDRALAADDLRGSIAHVHGLARAGLLTAVEEAELVGGLEALRRGRRAGRFAWDPALEDVHLNLEAALAERLGPVAGKLHTGRSRNDQVALGPAALAAADDRRARCRDRGAGARAGGPRRARRRRR